MDPITVVAFLAFALSTRRTYARYSQPTPQALFARQYARRHADLQQPDLDIPLARYCEDLGVLSVSISRDSCIAASPWCKGELATTIGATGKRCGRCYGAAGKYGCPVVSAAHRRNYELAKRNPRAFCRRLIRDVRRARANRIRLHGVGEIFSLEYLAAIVAMARHNPDVVIWTYTRTWTIDKRWRLALRHASTLPNLNIQWSVDPSMPDPRIYRGNTRGCSWMDVDARAPSAPNCPKQMHHGTNCAQCAICTKGKGNNILRRH